MTAEEIRQWGSRNYGSILNMPQNPNVQALETQIGQMLMLAEIAAQLAEANALTRFELGFDDEEKET